MVDTEPSARACSIYEYSMVRRMTSDALVRECITECDQGWSWGPAQSRA